MTEIFIKGFLMGASLIIAIGVQNAFVLRQGLKNSHIFITCLMTSLCDVVLISAGVLGFGTIVEKMPALITVITWGGVAFLTFYGLKSFYSAFKPKHLDAESASGLLKEESVWRIAMLILGVTFLNPHALLDTVVLIGGLSSSYQGVGKYVFGFGAMSASILWFFSLGYGARLLAPVFEKPRAWHILDILIGIVMLGIALSLIP